MFRGHEKTRTLENRKGAAPQFSSTVELWIQDDEKIYSAGAAPFTARVKGASFRSARV
jgi:hypothetical protein